MTLAESEALSCIRCDATMIPAPTPSRLELLRAWFVDGAPLRGQVELRCLECGAEATSTTHLHKEWQLPTLLRFVQHLHREQAFVATPLFHAGALAAGAAAGVLARRAGAPRWAPVAGTLTSTLAVRLWLFTSALEPGARWRSLVEAWDDTRDPRELERSTTRRIRAADFPFVGVAAWEGLRRVGGHGRDGDFTLSSVELLHDDADGGRCVSVETSRQPGGTQVEAFAEYQGHQSHDAVTVRVDGRPQAWRRYPPLNEEDHQWAAVGQIAGLSVAVQAAGIDPDLLLLTVGVDPGPYIAGSQAAPALRDGTSASTTF